MWKRIGGRSKSAQCFILVRRFSIAQRVATERDVRVDELRHFSPGGHARQPLLNPVAKLRLDEQIITQPAEWIRRHRHRHSRYSARSGFPSA
jgi:hypothetical protein